MDKSVSISEAKAHLGDLIERAEAGEIVYIVRRGKRVAKLSAPDVPRKPIDVEALRRITKSMPRQRVSAGEFIRKMRDTDRY